MPPQEIAIIGKYRVDTLDITRSCDLGIFERQKFVTKRGSKYFLRQWQDLKKPHQFACEAPFAVLSTRSGSRAVVADHPEGRCANVAFDRIGFGEGQGARRRIRILPLEKYIQ